jgi:transposase-like protein
MTKRKDRDAIYVKRQFDTEIIVLCVRWYITYRPSYRDLVAMMAERGVIISHTKFRNIPNHPSHDRFQRFSN